MSFSKSVEKIRFSKATNIFGKRDRDTVDFSLGEPKDKPPDSVVNTYVESLKDVKQESNRYAPVQGFSQLRERVAEKLRSYNKIDSSPEEVLITGGASEGIAFSLLSMVDNGDEVIVTEPSYPIVAPMVSFCGGRPVNLFLTEENNFRFDLEKLKELVNKKTRMLFINTPHNPTGAVFDKKCLSAISEIFEGTILVDEVYENFTYGEKHFSLASLAEKPQNVITVNSFSKTYCMCGYRVGYLHASRDIIKQMLKLKLCISTCSNNPAQKAASKALEDKNFQKTIKKRFESRRNILISGLRSLGIPFINPQGAFYIFPNTSRIGNDEEAFEIFLKAGVLTMPGSVFHETCKNHVRFSFVASEEEITKGIERLEGLLS